MSRHSIKNTMLFLRPPSTAGRKKLAKNLKAIKDMLSTSSIQTISKTDTDICIPDVVHSIALTHEHTLCLVYASPHPKGIKLHAYISTGQADAADSAYFQIICEICTLFNGECKGIFTLWGEQYELSDNIIKSLLSAGKRWPLD